MVKMFVLIAWLIFLLLLSMLASKRVLLTPPFGFICGFLASALYCLFWVDKWDLDLSNATLGVLCGGTALFTAVFLVLQGLPPIRIRKRVSSSACDDAHRTCCARIEVPAWKLRLFLLLQISTLLLTAIFIRSLLSGGNLATAIYYYRFSNAVEHNIIRVPFLLSQFRKVSYAGGFFWGYMLIHSIVYRYKTHRVLMVLCIIMGLLNDIILGARGGAVVLVMALVVETYIMFGRKKNFHKVIKFKSMVLGIAIAALIIGTFPLFGELLGRSSKLNFTEYLAEYLSAEIKNLDTFVRSGFPENVTAYNCQTLAHFVNALSGRFGLPEWFHFATRSQRFVNGYNLGNVYTTFYHFLYDGGYFGLVFFTTAMVFIVQRTYNKAIRANYETRINVSLIVYAYMFYCVLFSFFSNKFYEMVFSIDFVVYLVAWEMMKIYVEKIAFLGKRNVN